MDSAAHFLAGVADACAQQERDATSISGESREICKAAALALLTEDEIRRVLDEKKAAGVPCVHCALLQHVARVTLAVLHGASAMAAVDVAVVAIKAGGPGAHAGPALLITLMKELPEMVKRIGKVLGALDDVD